jgi:enoyl-[acyl-carrier protein] reductase II
MRTRITELFGIDRPILLSGMSWISVPELVAAVSRAGGLGILATGVLAPAEARAAVRATRTLTDRPFAANVTLYFPGARENARVLLDERVPVINTAMGKGDWIVAAAHSWGGRVIATVTTVEHARKAEAWGADALIVTGHEAAAHGGEVSSAVLVPAVVDAVRIPVVAAGGIADGRGLAAALALGAEGVAMGTRLMATRESPVHEACKQAALARGVGDTLYSTRFDGQPCRVMDAPGARRALRRGLSWTRAAINAREIAAMLGVSPARLAVGALASGLDNARQLAYLANAFAAFRRATDEGDEVRGVLPLGQAAGLVHDLPSVAELMERVVAEAEDARGRLAEALGAPAGP